MTSISTTFSISRSPSHPKLLKVKYVRVPLVFPRVTLESSSVRTIKIYANKNALMEKVEWESLRWRAFCFLPFPTGSAQSREGGRGGVKRNRLSFSARRIYLPFSRECGIINLSANTQLLNKAYEREDSQIEINMLEVTRQFSQRRLTCQTLLKNKQRLWDQRPKVAFWHKLKLELLSRKRTKLCKLIIEGWLYSQCNKIGFIAEQEKCDHSLLQVQRSLSTEARLELEL